MFSKFSPISTNTILPNQSIDVNSVVVEHKIFIDSIDRNISSYLNPFNFSVHFSSLNNSSTNSYKYEEPISKNILPRPHISRKFNNIKYIKVDQIILPRFHKLIKKNNTDTDSTESSTSCEKYIFDTNFSLLNERFIYLTIDELQNKNNTHFSTSSDINRYDSNFSKFTPPTPFSIILPERIYGENFYTGSCNHAIKNFTDNNLGTFDKLTFKFYDSTGLPLMFNDLFTMDEIKYYEKKRDLNYLNDLRFPLHKNLQVFIQLSIGVVEKYI